MKEEGNRLLWLRLNFLLAHFKPQIIYNYFFVLWFIKSKKLNPYNC